MLGLTAWLFLMLGRDLQKLDLDTKYEGHVEVVVSCKSSTWMLNMRVMSRPRGNGC